MMLPLPRIFLSPVFKLRLVLLNLMSVLFMVKVCIVLLLWQTTTCEFNCFFIDTPGMNHSPTDIELNSGNVMHDTQVN